MFGKKVHSILAIIFLAAFLSAQFAVYHSFSHDNDSIEHCKVCDEAISISHTPVVLADDAGYENLVMVPEPETVIPNTYEDPFHEADYQAYLYCRPPPSLT